jgi:sulfur relay (sulfurtransferase) complex TusBCD TusD component (DsrE family)
MDARGLTDAELAKGCARGSMAQLAEWTGWADKVLTF